MGWVKGEYLWIRIGQRGPAGVILVVRRKLGKAVERNRLKRRLRSICRGEQPLPDSLVVFPQPSATKAPYRLLREELVDLVPRL